MSCVAIDGCDETELVGVVFLLKTKFTVEDIEFGFAFGE